MYIVNNKFLSLPVFARRAFCLVEQNADGAVGEDSGHRLREQRRDGQEFHLLNFVVIRKRNGVYKHQFFTRGYFESFDGRAG